MRAWDWLCCTRSMTLSKPSRRFRDGLQQRLQQRYRVSWVRTRHSASCRNPPANECKFSRNIRISADAPSSLIFELILNLAEAGDFQRAESLFHNRFFPREEGGTNVRQVWVEVELQKMFAAAREGHCADALVVAEHLGAPVPDLPFTHDGLEPILQSARTNYLLGAAYSHCAKPEEAAKSKFQTCFCSVRSRSDGVGLAGGAEATWF